MSWLYLSWSLTAPPKIGTSSRRGEAFPVSYVWVLAVRASLYDHQRVGFPTIRTLVWLRGWQGLLYHALCQPVMGLHMSHTFEVLISKSRPLFCYPLAKSEFVAAASCCTRSRSRETYTTIGTGAIRKQRNPDANSRLSRHSSLLQSQLGGVYARTFRRKSVKKVTI